MMNELTGDCYEIDQAPSGAVDHVWHRLEELAEAICFDGRRMPRNLWRKTALLTDMLPELDDRVVALLAEYVRDGGRVPHSLRQDL